MTIRIKVLFIAVAAFVLAACNGGDNKSEQEKAGQKIKALPFPDAQIPSVITTPEDALVYLAENYWTGITEPSRSYCCDSVYVSGVDKSVVEQKFADWTLVLDNVQMEIADKAIANLYDKAYACEKNNPSSNVFETFVSLAQRYFYDPNSPLRNEDYYLPFVSRYAQYEGLSDVEKGKYAREARLCSLNRKGTKAADFRFADRRGRIRNLYDIKADLTLVFFSNPGCNACMEIINVLKEQPVISSLIKSGRMAVLNIYIDEDIQAWRSYMSVYPEQWYNGFDPDLVVRNDELYNIRAIPSLYLLDKEKNVLMKDVPENILFNYLCSAYGTGTESYQ